MSCNGNKQRLCVKRDCELCFQRSFASYDGKTENGKLKVDCWIDNKSSPREVFKSCNSKFNFKCDICLHKFESRLNNITSKNPNWCPYCKNKTEGKFKKYLETKYPELNIRYQPKYNWCKNKETGRLLPFDFSIDEMKIIIEIDGMQHFEQVSNWKCPEQTLVRDRYKMKKAQKHGYTTIRILQEDILLNRNNWKKNFKTVFKIYEVPTLFCIGCEKIYDSHLNKFCSQTQE